MNTFISQTMVECLGWTLVHFVWQGFVITVVLAIVLRLLRGASSHQRYLAGCLALVLMAVAPLITLRVVAGCHAAEPTPAVTPVVKPVPGDDALLTASSSTRIIVAVRQSVHSHSFAERVERFFPWLVLGWSLGVLALSCRLLGGWLQIQLLRRHGISAVTQEWHERMATLSERLGIQRSVRLLQSALVEVPTVIGWLRPMILLPASCIVGLSPAQLESILAHELAHIRRHDYLVNLLQSVVETVLFYHPAVWWVSRRVREEREHCCDDLAVEVSGDRAVYARALATLETLRLASAPLALGASGSPLLPRIRRLAGHSSKDTDRSAWPIAGIVVLILTAMLTVGLRGNRALAEENKPTNAPPKVGTRLDKILKPGKPRKIDSKLHSIEVDSIQFHHVPLWQVIRQLSELSKSLDPKHEGINFFLESSIQNPPNTYRIDPATGLREKAVSVDTQYATVTIDPPLHHVRMADVLDAIVRGANLPVRYSVLDYAVVFSPKQPDSFETMTFHVDPNKFRQGLQGTTGKPADNTNGSGSVPAQAQIRRFFEQAGVDLSTNTPGNAGKMLVWDDRTDILVVRSIPQDLVRIEKAIHAMIYSPEKSMTNSALRAGSLLTSEKETAAPQVAATNTPLKMATRLDKVLKPGNTPKIVTKLNSIEVDSIQFDHVPLGQVIRHVSELAKSLDPRHAGINFFLEPSIQNSTDPVPIDPATGLPEKAVWVDIQDAKVTIDPPLHHLRLTDVLDAIVRCADHPLRYSVLDYAVVFSPKQLGGLETRTFHVDPNTFRQGLQGTIGQPAGNPAGSPNGSPSPSAATVQSNSNAVVAQTQIRRFFESAGVDLSTNNPANVGKMFVWNGRKGILLVRASTDELDKVDAAIQKMNYVLQTNANKIYIAAKNPLGSPDVFSPSPEVDIKVQFLTIQDLDSNPAKRQELEQILPMLKAWKKPNTARPNPRRVLTVSTYAGSSKTNVSFVTDTIISCTNGIISKEQYANAIKALESMDGMDELNAPQVTTESGRQAQVQVGEAQTIVIGSHKFRDAQGKLQYHYETENLLLGPITDLIPRISPDGTNVDMKVVASVTEFLGYGLPGHPLVPEKPFHAYDQTYPNIRMSKLITDTTIPDGKTIVLIGLEEGREVAVLKDKVPVLGDLPLVGGLFRSTSTSKTPELLVVFITPTIIKPDGTPVHPDKVASDGKHPTSL